MWSSQSDPNENIQVEIKYLTMLINIKLAIVYLILGAH